MNKITLTEGFYIGIRRSIRNFSFTVPKVGQGITNPDMNAWFNQLKGGKKVSAKTAPVHHPADEKSTSFSGWIPANNAVSISKKCVYADLIYKAAGGDDPAIAQEKVKRFKKKAASVLSRCCETQEAITEATAAEINECACCVHEIKVVLLCVSSTEATGFRHDQNTGMWYSEVTVRKFYLQATPVDSLLTSFAEELADPNTTIDTECKLIAVRSDKVVQHNGRSTKGSKFAIRAKSDADAASTDAKLLAAVQRIRAKMNKSKQ